MNKIVKAVKPFIYKNNSNFKLAAYKAWVEAGGKIAGERYYEFLYKSLSYHLHLPTLYQSKKQARLRFVEAASLPFDTFPDYLCYEVVPLFWDCWPRYFGDVSAWMKGHRVRTAFFTSSQTAEHMRNVCPDIQIFYLPEAIETELYKEGRPLSERKFDYMEFGRCCDYVNSSTLPDSVRMLSSRNEREALATREMLVEALSDSKITVCLPRSVNQPEIAEGIETLTQRYWECMLSRVIMIGKAPKELIDILGYDPVVKLDRKHFAKQVEDILEHISEYQEWVDNNRKMALRFGDWRLRIEDVKSKLISLGYKL
ncbi:MAG: hypothetical protein IJY03_10475 [Prevotella sp.]|nr:hypothetical protein [Prevotella sp.]